MGPDLTDKVEVYSRTLRQNYGKLSLREAYYTFIQ